MPAFRIDGLPFLLISLLKARRFWDRSVRRRSGKDGLKRFDD